MLWGGSLIRDKFGIIEYKMGGLIGYQHASMISPGRFFCLFVCLFRWVSTWFYEDLVIRGMEFSRCELRVLYPGKTR